MKKKVAAVYVRVSTSDKQDYQRQVNDLTNLIKQHGYKESEIQVFAESLSGYRKSDSRPKLNELLSEVESSPSDYIIYTTEISRIGRNPTETRRIIDRLTDMGVPVYIQSLHQATIDGNGKRSMIMNIILQVLIEYSNLEAETFKTRSKSGLLNSAKQGKAGGSLNFPYGYTKDEGGYLVIDDEESKVIKEIFSLYKKGNGIKAISNILNERNIPTRTNKTHAGRVIKFKNEKDGSNVKWSDKQIHDIIRNTIYKGERKFKGEVIPAPAIITPELYDECLELMQSKTHRNYLTTYTYLLKDLVVCSKCGRNYFAKYKPVEGGDKVYICSSRLIKNGNCGNCGVNISLIESVLYDMLVGSPRVLKYLAKQNSMKPELESSVKLLKEQLVISEKELKGKNRENEKLLDLYLGGNMTKSIYISRKDKIENEVESLSDKVQLIKKEIRDKERVLNNIDENKTTKEFLLKAAGNRSELQMIFKQIFHKVLINQLDKDTVLCSVFVTIEGIVLLPIDVLIDISGMKKKNPVYRHKSRNHEIDIRLEYDGNILREPADMVLKRFQRTEWIDVPEKNWLFVE